MLTERAKTTFSWIRGKNWYWDEPTQSYVKNTEMADPLDQFIVRAKGSKKKLYWGNNKDLPKIDAKAFTKYIETAMKEGTVLDLGLGLDNLRKVQRSITLDKFMAEKALTKDPNFLAGLNICKGNVTYKAVADAFGYEFISSQEAIL